MPRRIGILGCGRVALHHSAALAAAGAELVAGSTRRADSDNWRAFAQAVPGARYVPDGASMLADAEIDAVVACLPWHEMPAWTGRLLACAKPVLIEKPLALAAAPLAALLAAAPGTAGIKMVGFNRRFYETVGRVRARLAQGGLKAVYATISEDIGRHVAGHGAGVIAHLLPYASAHSLDLLLHLLGPLRVERVYRHPERGYPAPFASLNGVLETAAGIPVFLALNADDPVAAGLRFLFDDHTSWVLAPLERLDVFQGYDIAAEAPGSSIRRYRPRQIASHDEPAALKPGFLAQARAFLGGDPGPAASPEESLALLRLVEALEGPRAPVGRAVAVLEHGLAARTNGAPDRE